jgi:glycerol-3-phosphate dehydrogenase
VNATGPFADTLLSLDNQSHSPIVQPSSGVHITLPNYYSPRTMGLLDPATSDGRVIFFLPWQGSTIAGTTDTPAAVSRDPRAQEEEIRWVLEEVRRYLSPDIKVRRGDVLSAWSGLRPLVRNPNAARTEGLVRNHMIHVSDSGLLTIAGGKWTTYRAMAEDTVDVAIETFGLGDTVKSGCVTEDLRLVGSDGWSRNMFIGLIQRVSWLIFGGSPFPDFICVKYGLETEVAKHLSDNYGDRAWTVCSLAQPTGKTWPLHGIRISSLYPCMSFFLKVTIIITDCLIVVIEAEIRYAIRNEYAQTAIDILARRTRLSFLNAQASLDALPRVVDIMAEELGWSRSRKRKEMERSVEFLGSMGLAPGVISQSSPKGLLERVQSVIWGAGALIGVGAGAGAKVSGVYSRALFEAGEIDTLKSAFEKKANAVVIAGVEELRLGMSELPGLVNDIPGYEGIRMKDYEYVLNEGGFKGLTGVDFDEFVEVGGDFSVDKGVLTFFSAVRFVVH